MLLRATSSEHLLFEEVEGWPFTTGRFTIVSRDMEEVGRFFVDTQGDRPDTVFSPDGQTIAISSADTAYRVPVGSARPEVLFHALSDDGLRAAKASVSQSRYDPWLVRVWATHYTEALGRRSGPHYFTWDGLAVPERACPGLPSPDGRYVAWFETDTVASANPTEVRYWEGWPSLVVVESGTCTPLFRVRSAWRPNRGYENWLPTSDGVVTVVRHGFAIAHLSPSPHLIRLPSSRPGGQPGSRPEPAPDGDGRYLAYGPSVYDVREDRWAGPGAVMGSAYWWGDSHRERWFRILPTPNIPLSNNWPWLLPPKIELPPISDETAFRVVRTGNCLPLREEPGTDNPTRDCLPDGERLVLAKPDEPPRVKSLNHDSVGVAEGALWVYVRTEQGVEGWASHDYLEHD